MNHGLKECAYCSHPLKYFHRGLQLLFIPVALSVLNGACREKRLLQAEQSPTLIIQKWPQLSPGTQLDSMQNLFKKYCIESVPKVTARNECDGRNVRSQNKS